MTPDELYAMEAETGRTSEWEPLYRAEKARADAAEAHIRSLQQRVWDLGRRNTGSDCITVPPCAAVAQRDAAEAAVVRVRAMCDRLPDEIAAEGRRNHLSDARADAVASIVAVVLTGIKGALGGAP